MVRSRSILVLSILATIATSESQKHPPTSAQQAALPIGPPILHSPNVYQIEPQFQYPTFNYIPDKQFYPGSQPPIIYYGGGALPGQQFLYRPGSPPGNFLIPQPQPGPGMMFAQTPVFAAGYPKPAHIPPIEKDAEEVPNLAGNHPPTRTGRPFFRSDQPEKIETFDEPQPAEEADELADADKVPNSFYPKKAFPNRPVLKPGQQFFILNGNTLFSNVPLPGDQTHPQHFGPSVDRSNPEPFLYHNPYLTKPQSEEAEKQVNFQPTQRHTGNYISLNRVVDFRQSVPISILAYRPQPQDHLSAVLVSAGEEDRHGKNVEFNPASIPSSYEGVPYPYVLAFDYTEKEDDDTVTINAKPEEEFRKIEENSTVTDAEEPAISQAKPSAIAVSGTGGVASASPRGTALVGIKGIAVANPEATAVAGPSKEEPEKKNKPNKEARSNM